MKIYLTRLTPNYNNWQEPSGPIGKCGLHTKSPYEGKYGFGWEEWFLNDFHNPKSQLEGYCYGFIQAFHKKNKANDVIDRLHLYTKICDKKRKHNYYLGYIDKVEVLAQPFTERVLNDKKNAFCRQAEIVLNNVHIHGYKNDLFEMCSQDTLFNVRFKSSNVHIQDFDFYRRPIKMKQGQSRFGLYDLEKHSNLIPEINKYI